MPVATKLASIDPATGEVIAEFEAAKPAGVRAAVERARRAQPKWGATPVKQRCRVLGQLAEILFRRRHEIAEIITREAGKPKMEALMAEVMVSLDTAEYYRRRAPRFLRDERVPHHNLAVKSKRGYLRHEPWGVVGIISPWNFPFSIPMTQVIPALVAGNAVVVKPSEFTPWSAMLVAELFAEAGLPESLLEIVPGDGIIGAALVEAGPDKIVFTGSVRTGRQVLEAASKRMIPCVLELGGKDAMLVLADADLDIASSAAVWGGFTNCGQACLSVERLYVEKQVADRFIALCVAKAKRLRLGSGLDPDAEMGPMIRPRQIEIVEEQLRDAVKRGAKIACGGKRRPDLGGYFFEPTVVVDVDHGMKVMQEETFAPVLAIQAVEDVEEAVERANDSSFGLAASVWTRNSRRGEEVARRLVAGAVMVNDVASYYGICEAPHGGRRNSGMGRTHSRLGLLEMVQVKYIDVERLPGVHKAWWYGYSRALLDAADAFLQMVFARPWGMRVRGIRGSLRAMFRGDRI